MLITLLISSLLTGWSLSERYKRYEDYDHQINCRRSILWVTFLTWILRTMGRKTRQWKWHVEFSCNSGKTRHSRGKLRHYILNLGTRMFLLNLLLSRAQSKTLLVNATEPTIVSKQAIIVRSWTEPQRVIFHFFSERGKRCCPWNKKGWSQC